MNVIAQHTLKSFAQQKKFAAARGELEVWYQNAAKARWKNLLDVQKDFAKAEAVPVGTDTYIVFNVCFNQFRLIVHMRYAEDSKDGTVFIKNFLTHAEYDKEHWKKIFKKEQTERKKLLKEKRKVS